MNGEVELVGAFTNEEQLVHCIGELRSDRELGAILHSMQWKVVFSGAVAQPNATRTQAISAC
jgi:hypothetical protein